MSRRAALLCGVLAGLPAAASGQDGTAPKPQRPEGAETRPEASAGCLSLELAAARRVFPPDRFAIYGPDGGWLGDVVMAESCHPLERRDHIYIHEKNIQWGRLCTQEFRRHSTVYVHGTACEIVGIVDATSYEGKPPEPVSKILQERPPRGRLE